MAKSLARHFGFYPPPFAAPSPTIANDQDVIRLADAIGAVIDDVFAGKNAAADVKADPPPDVDEKQAMRAFFGDPTA